MTPASAHHDVVVIGAGQAGLATSWWLTRRGIDHVVLERHQVAFAWREQRWDSFCLVTPNWQCQLPEWPYRGDDPDGFMVKSDIVSYLDGFAASFDAPVRVGVDVHTLAPVGRGGFVLSTSAGTMQADAVVIATGGYHTPIVPRLAERLPGRVVQLTVDQYRNPDQLPPGDVLIVGTGQSGAQLSEDLHLAGRQVHLSVGTAPRVARFYRGRDCVAWLHDMGQYEVPITEHPMGEAAAERTNHYVTGRGGGRDIDLRRFASEGMRLYGRLTSLENDRFGFDDDLTANLDGADAVAEGIKDLIDRWITTNDISAPVEERRPPVWQPPPDTPRTLDVSGVSTVIWCTGFARDYRWVRLPMFDGRGHVVHRRGVTGVEDAYVVGLPWLHTWGSGRFASVGDDAEYLTSIIAARRRRPVSLAG